MRDPQLERILPGLIDSPYEPKSPKDLNYNCVAFALGDLKNFWLDVRFGSRRLGGYLWVDGLSDKTVAGWAAVFSKFGYQDADSATLESEFERIAIYGSVGRAKHLARQKASGIWVSKLGEGKDIEHRLAGLEGRLYGKVVKIMKRQCQGGRRVLE
jgi:hypothetical protein